MRTLLSILATLALATTFTGCHSKKATTPNGSTGQSQAPGPNAPAPDPNATTDAPAPAPTPDPAGDPPPATP